MNKLVIMAGAAFASICSLADTEKIGDYTWSYRINGGTAEIFADFFVPAISPLPTGALTIPSSLGGKPVTRIGQGAFYYCSDLTSVTVPNSVTSIGDAAFQLCDKLTSVTIPDSVASIGDGTFIGCAGLADSDGFVIVRGVLHYWADTGKTSVTIPNSVTSIGAGAFMNCKGLTSVTIPDRVTSIGEGAFTGCTGLADSDGFAIVRGVLYYWAGVDAGKTSVTIPNGVTGIGYGAFMGSRLITVTIPNGVTKIEQLAFGNCDMLTSVIIPESVTSIEPGAFMSCKNLTEISVASGNTKYKSENGFLLSKDGKELICVCGVDGDVTIPNGVVSIVKGAFFECSGLTSVSIPDSVTSIGHAAFQLCDKLTSVTIPDSVTSLEELAFYGCENLVSASLPARLKNDVARNRVFEGCSSQLVVAYREGTTPSDAMTYIEAKDIVVPYEAAKAVTLQGAVFDDVGLVGIVELKLGKVSKGKSKVSGSVTTLDGKKHTIKAVNLSGLDGSSPVSVSLNVKDFGTMDVTIGGSQFAGTMGGYHVQSTAVGGAWTAPSATVEVAIDSVAMFSGKVLEVLLPVYEVATVSKGKWTFAKAASVKWAKPPKNAPFPENWTYQDAASGKGLMVDVDKGKTNLSGLKLTYTPKTGMFKGSFKVYELQGEGSKTKLKSYTVNVTGAVVGGVGYGMATCKKPAISWPVTVR